MFCKATLAPHQGIQDLHKRLPQVSMKPHQTMNMLKHSALFTKEECNPIMPNTRESQSTRDDQDAMLISKDPLMEKLLLYFIYIRTT